MLVLLRITLKALWCSIQNYWRYPEVIGNATRRIVAVNICIYTVNRLKKTDISGFDPNWIEDFKSHLGAVADDLCEAETAFFAK